MIITAIEDINAFWNNLGNRNKAYQVQVGKKVYKNMQMKYVRGDGIETFVFEDRK